MVVALPLGRSLSTIGKLVPKLKAQVSNRFCTSGELESLKKQYLDSDTYIIFVSSAGELEQAIPIMNNINKLSLKLEPLVIIFSESGIRFARSQGYEFKYIKSPWDDVLQWRQIFSLFKPRFTIVVRYELWPGFLYFAKQYGPLFLVNGGLSKTPKLPLIQRWILSSFDRIFLVSSDAKEVFSSKLKIPANRLVITGDSKYDRVFERVAERKSRGAHLDRAISKFWNDQFKIVLGSIWSADLDIFFSCWDSNSGDRLLIAPHEPSQPMIGDIESRLSELGVKWVKFSDMSEMNYSTQCIIIDSVGVLPELYACADAALVGGAFHYRVHNVLEPAVRGLEICFGSLYENSHEAVFLKEEGLATVILKSEDLELWLKKIKNGFKRREVIIAAVNSMGGASKKIVKQILNEVHN